MLIADIPLTEAELDAVTRLVRDHIARLPNLPLRTLLRGVLQKLDHASLLDR
jgi:hypothetical protein